VIETVMIGIGEMVRIGATEVAVETILIGQSGLESSLRV